MVTTEMKPFNSDKNIYKVYFRILKMVNEITTIKLLKSTKERLDKLKVYKRESYEEVIEKVLEIFNLLRTSPETARAKLVSIDRQKIKQ